MESSVILEQIIPAVRATNKIIPLGIHFPGKGLLVGIKMAQVRILLFKENMHPME